MTRQLEGLGVVPGIGLGFLKVLTTDLTHAVHRYAAGSPADEASKFTNALLAAIEEIHQLAVQAQAAGQNDLAEIMEAHKAIAADPELAANTSEKIAQGVAAPQAVLAATEEYAAVFSAMDDPYLKERAADLRDIGRRIARILTGAGAIDFGGGPLILCADEIEPSVAAAMPAGQVAGILLGQGSQTSHTIIIAKAQGIPTVSGLGTELETLADGQQVLVDGYSGQVYINPDQSLLEAYQNKLASEQEQLKQNSLLAELSAITKDGQRIQLAANIGRPADMDNALKQGCEGVGLFRSEFLYMGRDTAPSEEEQFAAYREVVERCKGALCIIRTMDIGGDKPLPYLNIPAEENPFLGFRAIRISLQRPELLLTQFKAILRAGVYGPVAIMLPMVINGQEIVQARKYLRQAMTELEQRGAAFARQVQFGIMIETPAAAVLAPVLAEECDFFSIGTNDLVQYTLAVDRGNSAVSPLYSHFHPAVLSLIGNVIQAAHSRGIWVGMCGEMAGDPLAAPLLTAMEIDELSMSAPAIPRVKGVIRKMTVSDARNILAEVCALHDAEAIRLRLSDFVQELEA